MADVNDVRTELGCMPVRGDAASMGMLVDLTIELCDAVAELDARLEREKGHNEKLDLEVMDMRNELASLRGRIDGAGAP